MNMAADSGNSGQMLPVIEVIAALGRPHSESGRTDLNLRIPLLPIAELIPNQAVLALTDRTLAL